MSLQKGFEDIKTIYRASRESPKSKVGKRPEFSLLCNYYCNLSNENLSPNEGSNRKEITSMLEGDCFGIE